MRVRVVTPLTTRGLRRPEDVDSWARPGTEASHTEIETGPASIESRFDEALAVPGMIAKIVAAEREGVDAVVIDCMGDPGLDAAREAVSIPVVGPCQAAMHLACMLAHSFSVVTVLSTLGPVFDELAVRYGVRDRLRSVRAVEIPVLELEADPGRLLDALADESVAAVAEDGAAAIVLGCTGFEGCGRRIEERLAGAGYPGIPVVDPMVSAFKLAELLAEAGLAQSRATYAPPREKQIIGYDVGGRR